MQVTTKIVKPKAKSAKVRTTKKHERATRSKSAIAPKLAAAKEGRGRPKSAMVAQTKTTTQLKATAKTEEKPAQTAAPKTETKPEFKPAPKTEKAEKVEKVERAATPVKKRDAKAEEKQASSARRMTDKTFKQKMADLQAEAQGEKATKKELFGTKRSAEAINRTDEAKRTKKQ